MEPTKIIKVTLQTNVKEKYNILKELYIMYGLT